MKREQPVLVGTTSIETSELLSGVLKENGIAHEVLNAKQHEREAHIVENAGMPGKVTIATNMAGRGTDIKLGGNNEAELEQAAAAAGEAGSTKSPPRASAPTGRSATTRWSPPADCTSSAPSATNPAASTTSCAAVPAARAIRVRAASIYRWKTTSCASSAIRIARRNGWRMAGMKEGEVIESGMLTRQIEKAQRKVESHNFDVRKQLLTFDDVANDQRKVIYQQRTELMGATDLGRCDPRHPRRGGRAASSTSTCPSNVSHEEWNLDRPRGCDRQEFRDAGGSGAVAQGSAGSRGIDTARPHHRRHRRHVRRQGASASASRIMRHVEKDIMLQGARPAMARTPRRHGLPAPGHPPARLRAEGLSLRIQARGFRAVRRHARAHQVRDRHDPRDARRAGEEPRADRARGRGASRAAQSRAAGAARRGRVAVAARCARANGAPQAPPPGARQRPPPMPPAAGAAAGARARPRSDATSLAPAAAARNSRTATACSRESSRWHPSCGCAWSRRRCSIRATAC